MVGKMNAPNVDFHDGLLINSNNNQLFMGQQQEIWGNMGTAARLESAKPPSSCIVSRFESPASAFYATERYMGLQQYDHHFSGSHQDSSQLQQLMKQSSNYSVYRRRNQLEQLDFKPFQSNLQDEKMQVGVPISQMGFQSRHDQNDLSPGGGGGGGSMGSGAGLSNKTRIRWTQDLHEKFVECVNRLGGADKATPKAILKLMDSEGLTIFHVKSHLQKYRIAKYMPDTSEGKADRRSVINDVSQLDPKAGFQIREAHQLQLDVQRRLHEQLEIQRNLQVRIEEQSKQLKMMFDHQQQSKNSSSSSSNNNNSNSNNLWGAFNVTTTTTSSNFQDGHHEPVFTGVVEVSVAPEEGSENVNFPTKIS